MTQAEQINKLVADTEEIKIRLVGIINVQNELTTKATTPSIVEKILSKITMKDAMLGLVTYLAASAHITDNTLHDFLIAFLNGL